MAKGTPSNILTRQIAFRAEASDEGIIKGYASLHNSRLTDNAHCEIFMKGCWEKSIRDLFSEPLSRGEPPRVSVCWQHDWGKPFAVATLLADDERGLYTEARVELRGPGEVNADAWAQVKAGLVTGLSVEIDPSRSRYEYLGEAEARELGYEGEWCQFAPPRRWLEVYLLGWAYVLVPSASGARVTEVRSVKARTPHTTETRAMDETTKAELMAMIKAACDPMMERIAALEAKMPAEKAADEMPDEEVEVELEEVRSLKAQVTKLQADADEARFQAWRAANAPALSQDVARHLYAAPDATRAAMLAALAKPTKAAPSMPTLGAGSGMREADAPPADDEASKRALREACARECKGDKAAADRLYIERRKALLGA